MLLEELFVILVFILPVVESFHDLSQNISLLLHVGDMVAEANKRTVSIYRALVGRYECFYPTYVRSLVDPDSVVLSSY